MSFFGWTHHAAPGILSESARAESALKLSFSTYEHDPLGGLLLGRLHLSPLGAVALGFIFLALSHAAAYFLYLSLLDSAFPKFEQLIEEEWPFVAAAVALNLFVVLPIYGFYVWVSRATGKIYSDLYSDGAVDGSPDELYRLVVDGENSLKRRACRVEWTYAAVAVTVLAIGGWTLVGYLGVWESIPNIGNDVWLLHLSILPVTFVEAYMICIIVAREIAVIRNLYKLLGDRPGGPQSKEVIRVQPWHPDKVGGLGGLNDYAIRFSWFIAVIGFGLALLSYQALRAATLASSYDLWIAIAVYVVLVPTLFFLALGSAHRAMLREKNSSMEMISNQLNAEYQAIQSILAKPIKASGGVTDVASSVTNVKHLQELYELTDRFPVWPFDATTIRRFATAVSSPLVAGVIVGLIVELLKKGIES